jgi:hypothetical protein
MKESFRLRGEIDSYSSLELSLQGEVRSIDRRKHVIITYSRKSHGDYSLV